MSQSDTILITGATSGIGRAAALRFARAGHRVIATGRRANALSRLTEEAPAANLHAMRLDVTDAGSIAEAQGRVHELTGGHGVDVLINNAGYGLTAPITEVDADDLRRQFETNVFGLVAVTRAFVPQMQERRSGKVINVGSVGGRLSMPFFGPYSGTKFAVEAMSDSLRAELLPFGVRVVVIEPGPIDTGFADTTLANVASYRRADSPYAPIYAQVEAMRARSDAMSVGPEVVARVLERAVRSRRPSPRYVVPRRFRLALALSRLLPTPVLDRVLARAAGLTRANLLGSRARPQLSSRHA